MLLSERDISELKRIIAEAGSAIMQVYNKDSFSMELKADDSPVTEADKRSDEIIFKGLKSLDTLYPILSEESDFPETSERLQYETFWLVDPLDGTKEFIARNGEFAVCIALIHKQQPFAGFVYEAVNETLYYAVKGKGAFEETKKDKVKLHVGSFKITDQNLHIATSRSHPSNQLKDYLSTLDQPKTFPLGSVLKMTEIARGNLHLYPRFDSYTSEWDIAAGQIIIEESGGSVLDHETGNPVVYNKPSLKNRPFTAKARQL